MNNETRLRKAKLALTLGAALICASSQASIIVDFGTTDMTYETLYSTFTTWSQTASTINVSGLDNQMMVTSFNGGPLNISGYTSFVLTAQVNGVNPNVFLQVEIVDSALRSRYYDTFTNFFGPTPTAVTLVFNPVPSDPLFDETDVVAFQLTGGGVGSPLNMTFHQLEFVIIPEPATAGICLAAVLIGAGIAVSRRLRRAD
jgi:hypothetical protein